MRASGVPLGGRCAARGAAGLDVREVRRFDSDVDRLWAELRPAFAFAAIRDSSYLNWRYVDAPAAHRLFEVRTPGSAALRAVFVLRHGWCEPSILALSDLLAAPDDRAALNAALAIAIDAAHTVGQTRVEMWLPPTHPTFRAALDLGMATEPGPANLTICLYRDDDDLEWYRRNWFFTIGDFDAA